MQSSLSAPQLAGPMTATRTTDVYGLRLGSPREGRPDAAGRPLSRPTILMPCEQAFHRSGGSRPVVERAVLGRKCTVSLPIRSLDLFNAA